MMGDIMKEPLSERLTSRKLWIVMFLILLDTLIPVLYKVYDVSDTVTLWVLSAVTVVGSAYLGLNVLQKIKLPKLEISSEGSKDG